MYAPWHTYWHTPGLIPTRNHEALGIEPAPQARRPGLSHAGHVRANRFPILGRVKTNRFYQTPNRQASVSSVAPYGLCLYKPSDRPRLPTLPPSSLVCSATKNLRCPPCLVSLRSPATRRVTRLECCRSIIHSALPFAVSTQASL